jgi:hypothetical protein
MEVLMAQTTRTFRIFVSSTFSDLKEERNALQKHVFPRLRDLCTQHGCRFQAIDLRWGVGDEAGLDQQTMRICLDEVARSQKASPKPNFIVLLGDRYGWRPLPAEIPEAEFKLIEPRVTDATARALLDTWFNRDENAVPPVYCLQPRKKGSELADFNTWERQVERPLRRALFAAVDAIGLDQIDKGQRLKYGASATEQEISAGALTIDDAPDHVFCYFRTIRKLPRDLSAKDFVDLYENGVFDSTAAAKLADLKVRLKTKLPGNIHNYNADLGGVGEVSNEPISQRCKAVLASLSKEMADLTREGRIAELGREVWERLGQVRNRALAEPLSDPDETESTEIESPFTLGHIPELCADVYLALARTILGEIGQLQQRDPLDKEVNDHDDFGDKRAQSFKGRASILETIADYVGGADRRPFAVFGDSGSGKSALMAKAVEKARGIHRASQFVVRYIGATPASSDGRALLESLCRQISRLYREEGGDEGTVPTDYRELVKELPQRLALATAQKPLILFLDALDQLSDADHARNLIWLPSELPEHVCLIVSTLENECKTALERRLPAENLVKLEPMLSEEGAELLKVWLDDARRTLQPAQRDEVLTKFSACGLPLYLKLAFEEARRWKYYILPAGPAEPGIAPVPTEFRLAGDIPGLIRQLFDRLSSDANHGSMIVSRGLGYLAAGKNGLTEDELLDVLSRDNDVMADFKKRAKHTPPEERLPVIVWSRLYFDLEPYLTERSADGASLLGFYHRQLRKVVKEAFLARNDKGARHSSLARYFASQELFEKEKKAPNIRKLSELPYQQTNGEKWDELHATLTDFDFLEAKCTHVAVITSGKGDSAKTIYGGVYELQEDYRRALEKFPA